MTGKLKKKYYHNELADYFSRLPLWSTKETKAPPESINIALDIPNQRVADELFHQSLHAGLLDRNRDLLSKIDYIQLKISCGLIEELVREIRTFDFADDYSGLDAILETTANTLKKDPCQLRSQLQIRNSPFPEKAYKLINKLIEQTTSWHPTPWFKSANPNRMTPPGLIRQAQPHSGPVSALALVQNEKYIATGSYDGVLCLLDAQTTRIIQIKLTGQGAVMCLATDDNGGCLAAGTENGEFFFWPHCTDHGYHQKTLDTFAVTCIEIISRLNCAAIGTNNGDIYLLSLPDLTFKKKESCHRGPVTDLLFIEKTQCLVSAGHDGQVIFSNPDSLSCRTKASPGLPLNALAGLEQFCAVSSPDSDQVFIIDLASGQISHTIRADVKKVRQLLSVSNTLYILGQFGNFSTYTPTNANPVPLGYFGQVTYSAIVPQTGKKAYAGTDDGDLLVYDIHNHDTLPFGAVRKEHDSRVLSIGWHSKARTLLTGTWNGEVSVWEFANKTLRLKHRNKIHDRGVVAARVLDHKHAVTASNDAKVTASLLDDLSCDHNFQFNSTPCLEITTSHDGRYALMVFESGAIELVDINGGKPVRLNNPIFKTNMKTADIDPAFSTIAAVTQAGDLCLFDLVKQRSAKIPEALQGRSWQKIAISGDAKTCAIAGGNGRLFVFSPDDPREPGKILHPGTIINMVMSHDGERLITASDDKTLRLFDIDHLSCTAEMALDDLPTCCCLAEEIETLFVGSELGHLYCFKIENTSFRGITRDIEVQSFVEDKKGLVQWVKGLFSSKKKTAPVQNHGSKTSIEFVDNSYKAQTASVATSDPLLSGLPPELAREIGARQTNQFKFHHFSTPDMKLVNIDKKTNNNIYEVYFAPDKQTALAFLRTIPRNQIPGLYYVIVETPQGNFGKDMDGIFDEQTGQSLD